MLLMNDLKRGLSAFYSIWLYAQIPMMLWIPVSFLKRVLFTSIIIEQGYSLKRWVKITFSL